MTVKPMVANTKTLFRFSGAGVAALFLFAACQQSEIPVVAGSPDAEMPNPEAAPEGGETRMVVDAGRKATAEEIAFLEANLKVKPASNPLPASMSLAKGAALSACNVDFNSSSALAVVPNQANQGYAHSPGPYYDHTCNGAYWLKSEPLNTTSYRLVPENSLWCAGWVPMIGCKIDGYCYNHTEGKLWPRTAGNLGTNTGVQFWAESFSGYSKDFEIRSLYVKSGTVQVAGWRPGIGWWYWYPLTAGTTWTWPAGIPVSQLQIYSHVGGYITFDNLGVAMVP